MIVCRHCNAELTDGVKFCRFCGYRVGDLAEGPKMAVLDNEDESVAMNDDVTEDEFFIEEGEEDAKGLDPARNYVMRFTGHVAELYDDHGALIRRYNMRSNVLQATINGENVSIVTSDGWTYLYRWDGMLIRRYN